MAEVLVIGNGGREDALRQAMESSPEVGRVVVEASVANGLEQFSGHVNPFVIIGPEAPLVAGIADDLRNDGYTVFGASKAAAQVEADKAFAVKMMRRAGVPHPKSTISETAHADRRYILDHKPSKYVIKANGLAGGKGVVLPEFRQEALDVAQAMREGAYDNAGRQIIVFQHRHHGPEFSAMVVVGDNDEFTILPLAQDHKRLGDEDTGPNTGGMGAYAPVPQSIVTADHHAQINDVVTASLDGMRADGTPYERAVLYVGGMISEQLGNKPSVIEYNCRFGDPETQVLMPLLQAAGVDVYRLLRSAAEGDLEVPNVDFADLSLAALTVCLAGNGYPGTPRKGDQIYGLDNEYDGVTIQQAAVKDGATNGGRVLYVSATGETIDQAAASAYAAIDLDRVGRDSGKIGFAGMQLRRDIGHQARSTT